jgi:hypothetical protein
VFVRIEVVDCFIQKPYSIVTSVFFSTNRPLYAQIILDGCIALKVVKRLQGFRTAGDAEARPVAVIRNTASRIHEGLMKYLLQPALVFVCTPSALLH